MSIPYENLKHAVADRVMGVVVWALRRCGVPARRIGLEPKRPAPSAGELSRAGDPDARPWHEDSAVVVLDKVTPDPVVSLVKPARRSREYCTFHGWHCTCGGAA